MATVVEKKPVQGLDKALRQLFRWGNLPRVRERLAARMGIEYDRASYSLIVPLEDGPLRISAVAERAGVDVSTASRQLIQLEREGVVRRIPDSEDRRASRMQLTVLGKRNLAHIAKARQTMLSHVLHDFSDADILELADLLGRLNHNFARFIEGDE
jgi:DNA-binding MarR family transcriptional regulator